MDLWKPVGGVFTASPSWLPAMDFWNKFEWFPFLMTTAGALAGVYVGARYAQHIAERNRLRADETRELREINAAIVVSCSIVSLAYALKKQHIKALKESYDNDCRRHAAYKENMKLGIQQQPFEYNPNFNSYHPIAPPMQAVQEIVITRLSLTGRALATVTAFSDAVVNLNHAITSRNEILLRLKDRKLPPGAEKHHIYFGTPYADGEANNEYGDLVGAMALYVDDVLFFGITLCEDLVKYGRLLADVHQKEFGGETPGITDPVLDKIKNEGLMPEKKNYEAWLSGFYEKPRVARLTKWQRASAWVKGLLHSQAAQP